MKVKCNSISEWGEGGLAVQFRQLQEKTEGGGDMAAEEVFEVTHRARGTRKDAVAKYEVGAVYDFTAKAAAK